MGIVAFALPSMAVVAEMAADWQNKIVAWAVSLPYGHFDIEISNGAMWGAYILFATATITLLLLPKREKKPKIDG